MIEPSGCKGYQLAQIGARTAHVVLALLFTGCHGNSLLGISDILLGVKIKSSQVLGYC